MGTKSKSGKKKNLHTEPEPVVVSSTLAPEHPESAARQSLRTNLSWLRMNRRELLILALSVVVAIAGLAWWSHSASAPPTPAPTHGRLTPAQVDAKVTAEQIASLQERIKLTKDKTEKYADEAQLSAIYYSQGNYGEALKLANDVEKQQHTSASAGALGDIYLAGKDYQNAVKFYTLARDRSEPPKSPNERSPYNDYNLKIKEAQAAQ